MNGIVFSGVQPTGNLHLGNYLGAIRNWVTLQDNYDCIFSVVDLHAITQFQEPANLRASTRSVAATYIAAGIDPDKALLFVQSQVPAHAELAWIFNCVTRIGWLNRMTQFKDKAGKNREKVSSGLYVYPNLMAADILAYKATHVPVGEDQKQHLELTRDIAQKFNSDFGVEFFPLPEPLILGEATRVMSLKDGAKKMSKSDPAEGSRIIIGDSADDIAKKIRKARTDPEPLPSDPEGLAERPEARNLVGIFAALSGKSAADVCAQYGGAQFSAFKSDLTDLAVQVLVPIGVEAARLTEDTSVIDGILSRGAERARALSDPILKDVQDIVGFLRS
ncbi:MAG: tryptophan--tRNA ligase [Alphaproteobacteria bacterium]